MYILVDELVVYVKEGLSILQACGVIGVDLPRFCYHEHLSISGNCRMCLVETNLSKKLVIACATPVVNKMVVFINSLRVRKARESILEFLLSNHPLDCPICDQGGECDLQDLTFLYGTDRGRFYEINKRSVSNKYFGLFIKTYMVRCIHCTRCVRFLWEICGIYSIGTVGRGVLMEISNYLEVWLDHELSGNIIDLCPVGALTSRPFSFVGRSWEFSCVESFDFLDGFCANIRFDLVGQKIVRVLPGINNSLNEEWITNKIRFFYDSLYLQRLFNPMINIMFFFSSLIGFCLISWEFVFGILSFFIIVMISQIILVFGGLYSLYMIYKFKELFLRVGCRFFNCYNIDFRCFFLKKITDWLFLGYSFFLLIGNNVRVESPLFTSKLRRIVCMRNIFVFLWGLGLEVLTFLVYNIGNNVNFLVRVFEVLYIGFFSLLKMFLFLGTSLFYRGDASNLYFLSYWLNLNNINYLFIHYTFNILHFFEFGLETFSIFGSLSSEEKKRFIYLVGMDELRNIEFFKDSFVVYQGAYGEIGVLFAFLILPVRTIFEVTGSFLNTVGLLLRVKESLSILRNLLTDDEILVLLVEYIKKKIFSYKFFLLCNLVFFVLCLFSDQFSFGDIVCFVQYVNIVYFYNSLFFSSVIDFYRNYIFCRVSKLLLDLSQKLNKEKVYI